MKFRLLRQCYVQATNRSGAKPPERKTQKNRFTPTRRIFVERLTECVNGFSGTGNKLESGPMVKLRLTTFISPNLACRYSPFIEKRDIRYSAPPPATQPPF